MNRDDLSNTVGRNRETRRRGTIVVIITFVLTREKRAMIRGNSFVKSPKMERSRSFVDFYGKVRFRL